MRVFQIQAHVHHTCNSWEGAPNTLGKYQVPSETLLLLSLTSNSSPYPQSPYQDIQVGNLKYICNVYQTGIIYVTCKDRKFYILPTCSKWIMSAVLGAFLLELSLHSRYSPTNKY